MPLNPKPLKVVSERDAKNPSNICGSTKNQVSVLACSSATGHTLPPYIYNFSTKNFEPRDYIQ